jgi:hypothetical protein
MTKVCTHYKVSSGYPVDFGPSLASFEPQILSIRRLVDFSLSSPRVQPPAIVFISSASVLRS